jgi:hypothetical protein
MPEGFFGDPSELLKSTEDLLCNALKDRFTRSDIPENYVKG